MGRDLSERSRRKHEAILTAATELFLEKGYAGTSMDDVASAATSSKQTVYKHFRSKKALFEQIVMATASDVSRPFQARVQAIATADDVPEALRALANDYLNAVMAPVVLRRRRLVVREAGRLPDLARQYHDATVGGTIRHLAAAFARLADRGELVTDDPESAAAHFAFLVVGRPLDAAMFGVRPGPWMDTAADLATDAFLAAYRR